MLVICNPLNVIVVNYDSIYFPHLYDNDMDGLVTNLGIPISAHFL